MTETSLRDALVDVRKAGRLLHDFNQRMFDMARVIHDSLVGYNFETIYNYGDGLAEWHPDVPKVDYWETLPCCSTAFLWVRRAHPDKIGPDDRLFGVQISADHNVIDPDADEDKLKWPTPENSASSFSLWLAQPTKEFKKFDASETFDRLDFDVPLTPLFVFGKSYSYVYNNIDLLALSTKALVREAVSDFMSTAEPILRAR
jgi:hypothetical protein